MPLVIFCLGTIRPPYRWHKRKFALVSDALSRKYQTRIIITGSEEKIKLASNVTNLMTIKPIIAAGKRRP